MSAFIRAALIDDDHVEFRRWMFSAMLVVALHGAVAMTVLAWHVPSRPFGTNGSAGWSGSSGAVFIDLTPLPAAQSPERTLPRLDAGGTAAAERRQDVTNAASAANRDSSAESLGLQRSAAEPRANGGDTGAPIAPLPQEDSARDSGGGGAAAASHAFAADAVEKSPAAASHSVRVDPGPLDTSITTLPALRLRKSMSVWILLHSVKHPGKVESLRNNPSALSKAASAEHGFGSHGLLSRAPGAHIQDRVNAAIERAVLDRIERARNAGAVSGTNSLGIKTGSGGTSSGGVHGNAIGAANANGNMGNSMAGFVNGTARNAVGLTVQVHPGAHGLNVDEPREGIAALKAAAAPGGRGLMAAPNTGILNGRGVARPGTTLTALGGPPKTVPGVLSGSDFRSKHQQ